ncbi:MAG: hypothetical protein BWZ10_02548 [candidate division BRC1 bacterium ADurb.BinA364]|nr:MAG: hypothetical protein BWZ10_02548 [candidate division BRC1 bacterium ADurb.BinA364]
MAVRRPERFDLDMRALREDRSRGRLQVRGGFDPATGESQGSVTASEFDLSALGPNVAEFAAGAAVLGGTISLDQSWSSRPDGNAISTHGTLECRDLVLQGGTEDDRSAPYSFSLQTDIRAENGRIWGGGPKNRAARMERFDGERSLDDWEIALDLNWRDEAASNSIALIGRSLDADSLLAVRETIRRNQSAARQRRIEAEKSFKERLARIQPEILTSSTLVQEAPPAPPPRIPVEEEEASETPDERPDWPPIRLEARLDKGSIGGRALENIRAQAWIRYPSIELESLSAAFEEASLRLEGACDLSSRPRFFRWRLAGEGVQAETVLGAVPNWRTDWLAGALDFVFEGQCRGASASQMSSSMEAALSVRARQGAVGKIDPLKSLGSFLGMDSFASFQYETLEAEASFARGKTTLQRLDARNSRQSLSLSGTIGMDGAIDWDADVGLKGDLYDSVKNLVIGESMTKDSAGYWHFPAHIRITGTLESAAAFFGAPALETAPAPQAESAN